MAKPPPEPEHWTLAVYLRLSDKEPFRKLLRDLARLHGRMADGAVTLEQATDELELILTTLMGETL